MRIDIRRLVKTHLPRYTTFSFFAVTLLCWLSASLQAAPMIVQINPSVAAPGQTISLTVTGVDRTTASNNLINFLQGGVVVGQVAAKAVVALDRTSLAKLTVTLPATLPPTTRNLSIDGTMTVQVGATGTPSGTKPFTYRSLPSLLGVTPDGVSLLTFAPNLLWQGGTASFRILGVFTHFRQGVTKANFGPGVQVGGATAGTPGPVTVVSPTEAVASLQAASGALIGTHSLTLATGNEQLTQPDALTVVPNGKPTLFIRTNAPLVEIENLGGSASVIITAEGFDSHGNPVKPVPSFTATPSDNTAISGSTVTFTRWGKYTITASATIDGQVVTAQTLVNVLGVPVAPTAGSGLIGNELNHLGRITAANHDLLTALNKNDTAGVTAAANRIKTELSGTDYTALSNSKLLGTDSDPSHDVAVNDGDIGVHKFHLPTRDELTPTFRANDDTFVAGLAILNTELDKANTLIGSLNTSSPTQIDLDKLAVEITQLTALTDMVFGSKPSLRGLVDNISTLQATVGQKLPALSKAAEQYLIALLRSNGYLVRADRKAILHDGVYRPGRDRHSLRPTQLLGLFSAIGRIGILGDVIYLMYGPFIGDIQNMLWVLALRNQIPTGGFIGITGTNSGLAFCANVVSIKGGTVSIFGFGFSNSLNDEVELHGSKSLPALIDCLDNLLGLLAGGKPNMNPIALYNFYNSIQSTWNSCADAIKGTGSSFDKISPGDGRLSGPVVGIDCNADFTDNTSEISISGGFQDQRKGTFDLVAILVVRNLDTGAQAILVVDQF